MLKYLLLLVLVALTYEQTGDSLTQIQCVKYLKELQQLAKTDP